MNERIRQLWDQAEKEIQAEYEDESRRNRRLYNEIFLPKFAELIVRECIGIAQDRAAFDGFPPNDVNIVIDEIKEHFGVEE